MLVVPLLARSVPSIFDNLTGIVDDLAAGEFGSAVDRAVAIMTEVNSIAGVFFLWFALITTVPGTGAGSVEPGPGNAAGAALGLTVAEVVGIALVASVVTTELARVARGVQLMVDGWADVGRREAACREVAEGIFALALTAVLFFLGPSIQRFARSIIQRSAAAVRSVATALERELSVAPAVATPEGLVVEFSSSPEPTVAPGTGSGRAIPRPAAPVIEPERVPVPAQPQPELAPAPAVEPRPRPCHGTSYGGSVASD